MSEGNLVNHIKPIDFIGMFSEPVFDDFENILTYKAVDFTVGLSDVVYSSFTMYIEVGLVGFPRKYESVINAAGDRVVFPRIPTTFHAGDRLLVRIWIQHEGHDSEILSQVCRVPYFLPAVIIGYALPEGTIHSFPTDVGKSVKLIANPRNHIKPIDRITPSFRHPMPEESPAYFTELVLTATFREDVSPEFSLMSEAKGADAPTIAKIQSTSKRKADGTGLQGEFWPGHELSVSMFAYEDGHKPEGKSGLVVVPALP